MKARLIYNPTSGQEIIKRFLADILERLETFGYETSTFATTSMKNSALIEAARICRLGEYDLIVAAGGDGTISQVVNGMASFSQLPQLAIIPVGTTNDFARALKIPRNRPIEATEVIGKNQRLKVDVGRVNHLSAMKASRQVSKNEVSAATSQVPSLSSKYFINIAATGSLSELTYSVPSNLKTTFGYLAYLAKGVELLPQIRKAPVRLSYDNGSFEGDASMVFIALTNTVGGFEQIAPDAKLDDGLFTVIIIKTDNLFEILTLLSMVAQGKGQHMKDVNTEYIKTKKLAIEPLSDKNLLVNLDGEFGGTAPIEFECLQGVLEIYADLDELSDKNYTGQEDELAYDAVAQKFAAQVAHIKNERKEKIIKNGN